MFFRQLALVAAIALFASAEPVNARVAPDPLPMDILHQLPELQMEHGSARKMCPITRVVYGYQDDMTHPDSSRMFDWVHPVETRAARKNCAIPAPPTDLYEHIG